MNSILIADDKEEILSLLSFMLKQDGYKVISANNGAEALEKARQHLPDLIISDILMPVMDGFALCREWKKDSRLKSIPFIFFTGIYTDEQDQEFALSLGADRFVLKTEEPDKFMIIIREAIQQAGSCLAGSAKPALDTPEKTEPVYLKQYNEALVRKLETAIEKLDRTNRELEKNIEARKRVEEELRNSEHRFHSLFDNMDEGVALHEMIYDGGKPVNYRIVDVNDSFISIFGMSREQTAGKLSTEAFNTPTPPYFEEYLKVSVTRRPHFFESYFAPLNKYFAISVAPWRESGFATIFMDITERKRMQEDLIKSEDTLKGIVKAVPVGIGCVSDRLIEWTNDFLVGLIGRRQEEVIGKNARIFYDSEESYNDVAARFYNDIKVKGKAEIDTFWQRKDGKTLFVCLTGVALNPANKLSNKVLFTAVDISERRKTLITLVESEKKYRNFLNYAPDGVFTIDNTGRFTSANRSACRITGYSAEELATISIYSLIAEESEKDGAAHFYQLMEKGSASTDLWCRCKDGSKVCLNVSAAKLLETQFLGFCKDITIRKQAQEALQKAHDELEERVKERTSELRDANKKLKELDNVKSEFLSLVSHELRTPLTSIKAFTEILLKNPDEDKKNRLEFLEIINNENERLTRLIDDVLDLSKIESGRVEWNMRSLSIGEILQASIDGIREVAKKNNIVINTRIEDGLPLVIADKDKIYQVMMNLLGNAVKYSSNSSTIIVGAELKGRFVEVFVLDSGIGIAPEYHLAVFERFKQLNNAQSGKPKGTGLGLTICKEIIEKHKGKIWVKSNPGKGSIFYFTIPRE